MREMKDSGVPWIGEIPKGWDIRAIKHCFHVVSGATPDMNIVAYWDGDIPWITPADYKTEDHYVSHGRRNITSQGLDSCSAIMVPRGSVVFSKRAPIGTVAISDNALSTNQGCLACIPYEANALFFYYALAAFKDVFEVFGSGTTFKEISITSFVNFRMAMPSLEGQRCIADFLDAKCAEIDSILEQTKTSIEEYKKLKQSVITEAVTKGIRGDRPMKDSGVEWIGEIPEEWVVNRLKFLFELHRGYDLANELFIDGGIPVYGSGGFMGYHNEIKAKGPNILIGRSGSTGKLHFVDSDFWPHNTGIYVCDFKGNDEKYIYYLLSALDMNALSTQTAVPTLDRKKIQESLFVFTFDRTEQQEIAAYLDEKCATIDSLIASKEALITELETYKKSLIYEYVTGKMIVAE